MTIRSSTRPHTFDRRDYSFHRTKPVYAAVAPALLENIEYNYDHQLTMYNQTIAVPPYYTRPLFYGCTGMCATDICTDQDGSLYSPEYTYEQTCAIEGHAADQGCDIRNSLKSLKVFPPKVPGQSDADAAKNRRGPYLNVDRAPNRDWFDSHRIALRANARTKTSISVGMPWFPSFQINSITGILVMPTDTELTSVKANINVYPWHCVKISGEEIFDNTPYLCVKSWQGPNVGNKGWLYMSRECFNKAYDLWGTYSGCPGDVNPQDVVRIRGELYQQLWDFVARLVRLLGIQVNVYA
jgi:hypothetical protein